MNHQIYRKVFCLLCLLIWIAGVGFSNQTATAANLASISQVLISQNFDGSTKSVLDAGWLAEVKRVDPSCPANGVFDATAATPGGNDCGYHTPAINGDRSFGYYKTKARDTASIALVYYNTLGTISNLAGSFDLESTWSNYPASTPRAAQLRGRVQGNDVALSYAIGNQNIVIMTPAQVPALTNYLVNGSLAQTWLDDSQMNSLGLANRNIAFSMGTAKLDVCESLILTWHGDENNASEQEMQVNIDNFVLNGNVTVQPVDLVQINPAWMGYSVCDVVNINGNKYHFGYDAFATLQAGIDAVSPNGTVVVTTGVYNENVSISKPLTLMGSNSTISSANLSADITFSGITANAVTVSRTGILQDGLELVSSGGTVTAQSGMYAGPLTINTPLILEASGVVTITTGTGPAVSVSAVGEVIIRGLTIQTTGTLFQQTAGNLQAYANNVLPGIATAHSGTGGTFYAGHNWWGSNDPQAAQPVGLSAADWQARLGARITNWHAASGTAILPDSRNGGGASLSGGTGTAVIVNFGRPANPSQAPFGNGVTGSVNSMCSDFYDFFVLPGASGNWQLDIPVDNEPSCNANVRDMDVVYYLPPNTPYETSCSPASNPHCWVRVNTANITHPGQVLRISNLSAVDLSGTSFVAGSGRNAPTAIQLTHWQARPGRQGLDGVWRGLTIGLIGLALFSFSRKV